MAQATFHFPRGFLWGTATAAYQVEGNSTNSSWYAWEQVPGHILNGQHAGLANDWWNGRWREDFHRAAEGGQNAHRMSVEWSRIQPAPDRWDEEALDRYVEMVRYLTELNISPMVTLHHFSDPQWLVEKGGWLNPQVVGYFEKFTRRVVEALKDHVSLWVTINEPNGYNILGYVFGLFPPGKKNMLNLFPATYNMVRAHAAAYAAIHSIQPHARVGMAINYRDMIPEKAWFLPDRLVTNLLHSVVNDVFPLAMRDGVVRLLGYHKRIPEARHTQDFLGLNYYTRDYVAFDLSHPSELFGRRYFRKDAELSQNGFIANEPQGFFRGMKWALQFKVPIIVTENGVEDADDRLRRRFLAAHIRQMWRGVNFNWPIRGYYHWTLVDNFEWERGWSMRFGLWELDVETQVRRKRPSADFYAEICRENGLSADMVARYVPEIFKEMFPN